jgi:predicted DCC family thiol-disulfide oxidoreductase YuxK
MSRLWRVEHIATHLEHLILIKPRYMLFRQKPKCLLLHSRYIIIFDGVCNFCNGAVTFIIDHDPEGMFSFTPMQSDLAKELAEKYSIDTVGLDTFILIKNGRSYIRTSGALEICKDLSGFWYLFRIFKMVPARIRDVVYRALAKNRYKLFGRQSECMVPTEEVKGRFIGV